MLFFPVRFHYCRRPFCVSSFTESGSRFRLFGQSVSRSRFLRPKNFTDNLTSKHEIFSLSSSILGHFFLLGSGSGSTDPFNPYPKRWSYAIGIEPCTVANNMYGIECQSCTVLGYINTVQYTRQKKSSTKVFTTQSRMYQYRGLFSRWVHLP
jgi:hypothetical protein